MISDFKTLGGAGFASQAYTFTEALKLPVSSYSGLRLRLLAGPGSENAAQRSLDYTLVLKTGIPPLRPDGRKESTVNYEYTFSYPSTTSSKSENQDGLFHSIPWKSLEATYRGRKVEEGNENYAPLDPGRGITEISFMCRSGFGEQEGHFNLLVGGLEAVEVDVPNLEGSMSEKKDATDQVKGTVVSEKKGQADAYYVPVEEQSEEDKTWMRVALDMVSLGFDSIRRVSSSRFVFELTSSLVPFFLCYRMNNHIPLNLPALIVIGPVSIPSGRGGVGSCRGSRRMCLREEWRSDRKGEKQDKRVAQRESSGCSLWLPGSTLMRTIGTSVRPRYMQSWYRSITSFRRNGQPRLYQTLPCM